MRSGFTVLLILFAWLFSSVHCAWSEEPVREGHAEIVPVSKVFQPDIGPLLDGPNTFLIDPNANLDRSEFPQPVVEERNRSFRIVDLIAPTFESAEDFVEGSFDLFSEWTKRIELGARFIDGNSDQDFLNTAGRFEKKGENWLGQLEINGQLARAGGTSTTNRWNGNVTYDYGKHGKWIVFATAKNEYDEFEGLEYRGTYSSGLGYRFFNEKDRRLIARLGPGVTYERFTNPIRERTTPDAFAELEINWPVFRRSSFESKTTMHPSLNDVNVFRLTSQNGLLFKIDTKGAWKLKLGFRFDYNSRPNNGRLPADYTTNILLVYTQP